MKEAIVKKRFLVAWPMVVVLVVFFGALPTQADKPAVQDKHVNLPLIIRAAIPNATPTLTPTPTVTATPLPTVVRFAVRSIESMNQTKDRLCNQPSDNDISWWVRKAKEAGATHVTIAVPYDNPPCVADSYAYAMRWANAARAAGLHIWWRQVWREFEGIYDAPVVTQCNHAGQSGCNDYITRTREYILTHPAQYAAGDIFSFTAEPAASRIRGVNCFNSTCVFESASGSWNAIPEFNAFLVDSMTAASAAFAQLGIPVDVNAGGLDAYVAVGYDNPDWGCDDGKPNILYPSTVSAMGGFILDHYYDPTRDSMHRVLTAIAGCYPAAQYPNIHVGIGEWGPVTSGNTPAQITVAIAEVLAMDSRFTRQFNYWQGGPAGQEQLFTPFGNGLQTTENYSALKTEYLR